MADSVRLEVITPEKVVVDEDARVVVAPGALGQFGILPGHTAFFAMLKTGALHYRDQEGIERIVFVDGGFAAVCDDKVSVLTEAAERRKNIDIERARAAMRRAEERLAMVKKREDIDFERAHAALQRAILRIRITETRHQ